MYHRTTDRVSDKSKPRLEYDTLLEYISLPAHSCTKYRQSLTSSAGAQPWPGLQERGVEEEVRCEGSQGCGESWWGSDCCQIHRSFKLGGSFLTELLHCRNGRFMDDVIHAHVRVPDTPPSSSTLASSPAHFIIAIARMRETNY